MFFVVLAYPESNYCNGVFSRAHYTKYSPTVLSAVWGLATCRKYRKGVLAADIWSLDHCENWGHNLIWNTYPMLWNMWCFAMMIFFIEKIKKTANGSKKCRMYENIKQLLNRRGRCKQKRNVNTAGFVPRGSTENSEGQCCWSRQNHVVPLASYMQSHDQMPLISLHALRRWLRWYRTLSCSDQYLARPAVQTEQHNFGNVQFFEIKTI